MRYLTINGSSHYSTHVECALCKKKYIWLRAYPLEFHDRIIYVGICHHCKKRENKK